MTRSSPDTDERRTRSAISARLEGRVLVVTLETPGEVNVLSRAAARQLSSVLCEVDEASVDALVLRSGKRRSYLNGVGLMLAGAVRTPEDVARLSAEVRTAYRMLEELTVPTIAAIRGNCYGCGVELAIRCDHRIAADDFDTHFYMPEVVDYLFVPCFGATAELPRLVGLPRATELLLWGKRWSGADAVRSRLVDACVPADDFDAQTMAFALDVVADRRPPATRSGPALVDPKWVERTWRRIDAMPREQREVYRECFELMHRAATGRGDEASARGRELLAAGRTVASTASKAAQGFFFARETARVVSVGEEPEGARYRLVPAARSDLLAEIASRRSADVLVGLPGPVAGESELAIVVGSFEEPDGAAVAASARPFGRELGWPADVVAHAPMLAVGGDVVEVACRPHAFATARNLCAALARAGMKPVLTSPSRRLLTDDLADAYATPLVAWLRAGGSKEALVATLHSHGRVRPLADVLALLPPAHPGHALAGATLPPASSGPGPEEATEASGELMDALDLSLGAAAIRAIEGGVARHPAIVDLVAREALDYPLTRGSLCRWLDAQRLGEILSRADRLSHLVKPVDRERVHGWLGRGRSFYG